MATRTGLTMLEYIELCEKDYEGRGYELSEGELLVSPYGSLRHNEQRDRLNARLRAFMEPRRLGIVTSETEFRLGGATVRRPDVAVIRAARYQSAYGEIWPIPLAPDLVFEVVSKHDRPGELQKKVGEFLAAGTRAVWLLYPQKEEARRCSAERPEGEARAAIEEAELLPGFALALAELFAAAAL